jgi:hypothetical protein
MLKELAPKTLALLVGEGTIAEDRYAIGGSPRVSNRHLGVSGKPSAWLCTGLAMGGMAPRVGLRVPGQQGR